MPTVRRKLTYGPVKLDENGTLFRVNITGGNVPITSQSARLTVRLQENLAEFQHGLKAFYPFNGNANDESGNDNNGTVNGAALTTDRNGETDNAYYFDGNSSITTTTANNLPIGNHDFSISIWLTFDEIKALGQGFLLCSQEQDQFGLAFDTWTAAEPKLQFYTGGGAPVANAENLGWSSNDWYQVVLVREGDTFKFYRAGTEVYSSSSS